MKREWFSGDVELLAGLQRRIAQLLRDEVLLRPRVRLVEPGSFPKAEGKAVRVIDRRKA